MKIYLANGLFCEAERSFNNYLYTKLTEMGFEVYAPQNNAAINDKTKSASSIPIYDGDTERLKEADVLIAVLDGYDLGVASEVGWVAGWNEGKKKQKQIIGLYTDNRDFSKTYSEAKVKDSVSGIGESQFPYINLYTIGAIKKYGKLFGSSNELLKYFGGLKDE